MLLSGILILEALGFERQVVSTGTGGMPEIVDVGVHVSLRDLRTTLDALARSGACWKILVEHSAGTLAIPWRRSSRGTGLRGNTCESRAL